jgi:hypothetical protein
MPIKTITAFLFILFCNPIFSQVDFSEVLKKKTLAEVPAPPFSDFKMNGEVDCFAGNCKNGKGVLKIVNAYRLIMYVAANFENKEIVGEATILTINIKSSAGNSKSSGEISKLKSELEKALLNIESTKVYEYYQRFNRQAIEAYFGTFDQNILKDGLYTFNGTLVDLDMQIRPIPLKHLYHITPGNKIESFPLDKHFSFNYRGEFKPEYGDASHAFTLNRSDDHIEIVPEWTHDIIVKTHPIPHYYEVTYYDKNGRILNEVLSHNNLFGTVGWQKEFVPGAEQALSTIETKYNTVLRKEPVPNVGIVAATPHPYKDGVFYGWLNQGKPAHYGIFMNDYYLYEGFFDENGEFDGYGFFTLRRPLQDYKTVNTFKQKHVHVEGYLAGIFSHGQFDFGAVAKVEGLEGQDYSLKPHSRLIRYGKMACTNPMEALNFERTSLYSKTYKHHALQGEGSEFSITSLASKDLLNRNYSEGLISAGTYQNGLLEGSGTQRKEQGKGYWTGEFVNGKITDESKRNQQKEESLAHKKLEQETFDKAPYPPGSIVKKGTSFYYVNELKTNNSIEACYLPLQKDKPLRGQERLMGDNIYYNAAPLLWANPYFGQLFHKASFYLNKDQLQVTGHVLCERCNGFGQWLERVAEHGTSTETTTRWTRTYEGVFYDKYENVSTTKSVPTTTYVTKKVTCPVCSGAGHH